MIILGIDPGLNQTGYGVIQVKGREARPLEYGVIRAVSHDEFFDKLHRIFTETTTLVNRYQPALLSVESVFVNRSPQSALKLGHARASAITAALARHVKVVEYAPREIKLALTGSGASSKEQVQFMVKQILAMPELPAPLDASDALAVAITAYHRRA